MTPTCETCDSLCSTVAIGQHVGVWSDRLHGWFFQQMPKTINRGAVAQCASCHRNRLPGVIGFCHSEGVVLVLDDACHG